MAQVRITHQDGTVDEITTSGANQQIQVQQGDKIEVLNATLASATVDGNNYVVTLTDPSGTVEITFVDLFLLLATGDPQTAAVDATSLFIGETEISSIGDALSQVATAAGPGGGGAVDGGLGAQARSGGSREAPEEFQAADLGTDEAPRGPLLQDFPSDEFPTDDPVTPDEEVPVNLPPTAHTFDTDASFGTTPVFGGGSGGGGGGGDPIFIGDTEFALGQDAFPSSVQLLSGDGGNVFGGISGEDALTGSDANTGIFNLDSTDVYELTFPVPIVNQAGDDLYFTDSRFSADALEFSLDGGTTWHLIAAGDFSDTGVDGTNAGNADIYAATIDISDYGIADGDSITSVQIRGVSESDPTVVGNLNTTDGGGGGGGEPPAPALDVTTTDDGETLVNTILGSGITVSNIVYNGAAVASGTFVGGEAAGIGIESGILLTSGSAETAEGPNSQDGATTANGLPGDADLTAIAGVNTNDATILEFDFISDGGDLFFSYVFASEEYNEYANGGVNDTFGFFLDGVNVALIPGTDTGVSINTVNGGNPYGTNEQNSEYFNNNDLQDGGPFFAIEYDGFTDVFTVSVTGLEPGEHHIKLAIADGGDSILDSGVFIQAGSFSDQSGGGGTTDAFHALFDLGGSNDAISIGGTDPEDGLTTTYTITGLPSDGTLWADLDQNGSYETQLQVGDTLTADGDELADNVLYVAESRPEDGQDEFTYTTTDSQGAVSSPATVTIDFPNPVVSIESVVESEAGSSDVVEGDVAVFHVFLEDGASTADVTVDLSAADGSATGGEDYNNVTFYLDAALTIPVTSATISAGDSGVLVYVATIDDTDVEGNEDYDLNISNPTNATLGTTSAEGTIFDNDALTLTLSGDTAVDEGALGAPDFAVTLSDGTIPTGATLTADLTITLPGGTDALAADFIDTFLKDIQDAAETGVTVGSATVNGNDITVELTFDSTWDGTFDYELPTFDDVLIEGPEDFSQTLSNAVISNGGSATATGTVVTTIIDNDALAGDGSGTVDEAALDTIQGDDDLAPGTVEGSNPSSIEETATGSVTLDFGGGPVTDITNISLAAVTDPNDGDVPVALTSGGDPVSTQYIDATNTLIGYVNVDGTADFDGNDVQVFEMTLGIDGNFIFTLTSPIDQPDAGVTGDGDPLALALSYTATDGVNTDGGTITITVNDDGPSITATGDGPNLTVDETTLGTDDVGSFENSFNGVPGADGEASTTYALSVDGGEGFDSGLVDMATGESILLYNNGGVIEGRTSGTDDTVFTVTVDGSGNVELDQLRAIEHDPDTGPDQSVSLASGLLTLTATITDNDGDTDTATLDIGDNLSFEDDAPSITATGAGPNLTVDETTLGTDDVGSFENSFNGVPGADGEASTTYALSVDGGEGFDSGLVDTVTGESILLYSNGGVIEGRTSGTDDTVFTVTVDGSGNVELDQLRAIEHDPDTGPDQSVSLASGLLTLTATITDNDGDTDTATLDIGDNLSFEDDAPIGGTAQTLVLTNSLSNSGTADLNFVSFGADGDGGHLLTMAMASDGTQTSLLAGAGVYGDTGGGVTQLTSNGTDLVWEDNLDGSWSAVTDDANADVVFTVDVNADGTYTVTMDGANPLDGAFTSFTLDFTQGVTGGNNEQLVFFDSAEPDVAPADGIPDGSTIMALAVGTDSDGTTGTVNSSTQGMGVSQGNTIDVNGGVSEELSLFFADPQDPSTVTGPGSIAPRQQSFATIRLDSLNGGEFAIIVVHITDTNEDIYFKVQGFGSGASTDELVTITQGTEGDGSLGGDGTSAATAYEVDMSVDGFGTLYVDGTFDHLHFEADVATDSSYRLVSASGTEETSGFDVDTSFTVTSTDGDGDTVDTEFDVTLDSGTEMNGTAGDDVLIGNGGQTIDQVINGLGGNDIIDGGAGADTIDGGAGDDVFVYNAGSNVGVDIDEILAFNEVDDSFLFDGLGVTDSADVDIVNLGGNDALQINGTDTVADLGTAFGTLQVDAVDINGAEATVTLSLV